MKPKGDGHTQAAPGGPGGWAQHQKRSVKQIVPGTWLPTCAEADPVARTSIAAIVAE